MTLVHIIERKSISALYLFQAIFSARLYIYIYIYIFIDLSLLGLMYDKHCTRVYIHKILLLSEYIPEHIHHKQSIVFHQMTTGALTEMNDYLSQSSTDQSSDPL